MINIQNLHIQYGKHDIVDHVTFIAKPKEFIVLTGDSGTGKSSILNFIGCLENFPCEMYQCFDENVLTMSRQQIEDLRRNTFGYVFQDNHLFSHLSVKENLQLFAQMTNTPIDDEDIKRLLDLANLNIQPSQLVSDLSGGERQRLAVLCALVKQPKVLLVDEATSHLDKDAEEMILTLLQNLTQQFDICVIMSTHSKKAQAYASSIYEIKNHKWYEVKKNIIASNPKNKQAKKNKAQPLKQFPIQKNARMYVIALALIAIFSLTLMLTSNLNKHLNREQVILLNHLNGEFTNKDIETFQKAKGVNYVNYFYELFLGDYVIQGYDEYLAKNMPLEPQHIIITQDLVDMWEVEKGDSIQLPISNQSLMISKICKAPIYKKENGLSDNYVYMPQDEFPEKMQQSLIIYVKGYRNYQNICENIDPQQITISQISTPIHQSMSSAEIMNEQLYVKLMTGLLIVFMVMSLIVKIYMLLSHAYPISLLYANGITLKEIKTFFKKQCLTYLKYELSMVLLMDMLVRALKIIEISILTIVFNLMIVVALTLLAYIVVTTLFTKLSIKQLMRL